MIKCRDVEKSTYKLYLCKINTNQICMSTYEAKQKTKTKKLGTNVILYFVFLSVLASIKRKQNNKCLPGSTVQHTLAIWNYDNACLTKSLHVHR